MRVTTVAALASCLIFAAACSDSATGVPSSALRPGGASFAGNPPPPPLTGRGDGDLSFDSFEILSASATIADAPTDLCGFLPPTPLSYALDYLINKAGTNQWAHLNLDGQNRQITVHQTDNKVDASGEIVGVGYVFRITGGAGTGFLTSTPIEGSLRNVSFSVQVNGIATLTDGTQCRASATLSPRHSARSR